MENKVYTSCEFCEFRKGLTCELDLLKNVEIEEHDKKEEYNVIKKFCLYRRPNGWKKHMQERIDKGESYLDIARSELKVTFSLLVYLPTNATEKGIKATIQRINSLIEKPKTVIFMNNSNIKPAFFFDAGCKFDWSCEQIFFDKSESKSILRAKAIHITYKKVKTIYFAVMDYDEVINPNFINIFNELIIDKEENIICVKQSNKNSGKPFIYQTRMFKNIQGNANNYAIDKIEFLARKHKCKKMIKKYQEIFD